MDLSSLQAYYNVVSKVIENETSTITGTQAVQTQYDYLIMNSQSTINGLSYEITANSNLIIAGDVRSNLLVQSNATLDSSIILYNSSITGYSAIIDAADRDIVSLTTEASSITAALTQSDFIFNSTAVYYSSLYMSFMARDQLYQNCLSNISTTSTLLSNAIIKERLSFSNWQISSAFTVARSSELSTLYLTSNAIKSTLTQYITNETNAITNLNSTNNGLIAISSLYTTALVNQQYYQALSTQTGVFGMYSAAYSTYMTVNSQSSAAPTNTVLLAAKNMSQQRLSTLTVNSNQSIAQVTALRALVAGATTDTYAASLKAAEDAIQLEVDNVRRFQGYYDSSISAVSYFSSLYEQASVDITSSLQAVSIFSTFYTSSIAGSNALMALAAADDATIATQQSQIDTLSLTISSLDRVYSSMVSSFSGWISYSSLMTQQIAQANTDLLAYSTFFESTNMAIINFNSELQGVESSITGNLTSIRTQSSILESETINMIGFQTLIGASFNMQEHATYQYRETYVRLRRLALQQYYDSCVLQQVQATSTQNGNLVRQAAGAAFTPIAINLNTPTINLAYNNLTTVTTFLNSFTSIYTNYDIQRQNLLNVSTSVGNQREAYSTLTTFSNQFQLFSGNPTAGQGFSNAQTAFITRQNNTRNLQSNAALTQAQINTAKNTFLTTYQAVFLSSDIIANESTISSFLIQGFRAAGMV